MKSLPRATTFGALGRPGTAGSRGRFGSGGSDGMGTSSIRMRASRARWSSRIRSPVAGSVMMEVFPKSTRNLPSAARNRLIRDSSGSPPGRECCVVSMHSAQAATNVGSASTASTVSLFPVAKQFSVDKIRIAGLEFPLADAHVCTKGARSMKISRRFLVLAVVLAALPIAALAQFETASVLGTVRDGTGAVIVGSKVTLENVKTGVLSTTQSNDSGNFDFI